MVVTNDDRLADRLRLLRNLAFTTPRFVHHVLGFNFRMTGYQAAMGLVQLRKVESIVAQKRRVAHAYHERLQHVDWLQLPAEREWARNVYWMYAVVVRRGGPMSRDQLMAALRDRGIETRTFFCPLDQQPCLQALPGFPAFACPVADDLWETGLYLPSTHALTDEAIDQVVDAIEGAAHAVR
jgi:perosamine synthetase